MPNKSSTEMPLRELRQEIAKLTGRVPVSNDVRHLRRRLDDLRARKRDGEDVARHGAGQTVLSVSMSYAFKDSVIKLSELSEIGGVSALVRRALVEYAKRHHQPINEE